MKALKFLFLSFLISFASFALANPACSQDIIAKIDSFLELTKTSAIPFEQSHEGDQNVSGILLINKPLKFRVNYDPPHPLVIAGGKNFVSLYDYELDELSRIDSKDNMFRFLLELNTKIETNIKILSCKPEAKDIELELLHNETQQKAKITFTIQGNVFLKNLKIPDDGNNYDKGYVIMNFKDPIQIRTMPGELFVLKEPKIYGSPRRYTSLEIIEMIEKK